MKRWDLMFITIGCCIFITNFFYYLWWQANAPYCCVYMCGSTMKVTDCLPGLLIPMFTIIGFLFFTAGLYNMIGDGKGTKHDNK